MKLLLDQNCSAGAAEILRSSGMDVVHTREVGLAITDDQDILQWCRDVDRIVVTLDADFHAHLALTGARTPSVIRSGPDSNRVILIRPKAPPCRTKTRHPAHTPVPDRERFSTENTKS